MEASANDTVRIGALELRFAVNQPSLVVFEFVVPPNARVPAPHYHRDVDEAIYGLEGTLTTTIGADKHAVSPGSSRFIPRGVVHNHENLDANVTARALIVMTPGSINRDYFEAIAEQVNSGRPDMQKIKDTMLRFGLVPSA